MDDGPFRMPQSAGRGDDKRAADDIPLTEEPKKPSKEPKPVQHSSSRRLLQEEKSKKPFIIAGIAVVVVLVVVIGGWVMLSKLGGNANGIDAGKYQAVFFTNGQVYFGKLQAFNTDYLKLTHVFYLQQQNNQDSTNPQKTTDDQKSNSVQLIKLGDEIHGPQDEMVISKDQVLFYENLKSDGKVASSIQQYNDSHK